MAIDNGPSKYLEPFPILAALVNCPIVNCQLFLIVLHRFRNGIIQVFDAGAV